MTKVSKITKLVEKSFVNSIGQTINVGDKVVYVGSGYSHRITVGTGVYAGMRVGLEDWQKDKDLSAVVKEVPNHLTTYKKNPEYTPVPYDQPGYYSNIAKYWLRDEDGNMIVDKFIERYRVAILPLKRVFKIDTSMMDVSGKKNVF